MANLKIDENFRNVSGGIANDSEGTIRSLTVDATSPYRLLVNGDVYTTTNRLLVDGRVYASYAKITYPGDGVASGTTKAKTGSGAFVGIMCTAAANTPTLTIYDNTTNSGTTMLAEFTPVAGTLYSFAKPIAFYTGLYALSSGSVGCTISYY